VKKRKYIEKNRSINVGVSLDKDLLKKIIVSSSEEFKTPISSSFDSIV